MPKYDTLDIQRMIVELGLNDDQLLRLCEKYEVSSLTDLTRRDGPMQTLGTNLRSVLHYRACNDLQKAFDEIKKKKMTFNAK